MGNKIVSTVRKDIEGAVNELKGRLEGFNADLVLYFASSSYDQVKLAEVMKRQFGDVDLMGSSTSGELISGKMLVNSLVAMAFTKETIGEYKIELVEGLKENGKENTEKAFNNFGSFFGDNPYDMDITKYLGMVLIDGLSGQEEKINERIGEKTDVRFVGGSAGDDLKFEKTYVHFNGKAVENASVLILMKPNKKFEIVKTQSFVSLDEKLTATKVNEETREVIEFNNKPATEAYAEALGVSTENLEEYFMSNPLGLNANGNIFVRSPQQIKGTSIIFYCNILEGMEVELLKSTSIISDTENVIKEAKEKLGSASAIINYNCILRTLELRNKKIDQEYGQLFEAIPTVGLSTYGESYLGHINQTATMIVFK